MTKCVLIVATQSSATALAQRAGNLGYRATFAAAKGGKWETHPLEHNPPAQFDGAEGLSRLAQSQAVDGIYPAERGSMAAVAGAAERLGLPGFSTDHLGLMAFSELRHRLRRNGIPQPPHSLVDNVDEASEMAASVQFPLYIIPPGARPGVSEFLVTHKEDLPFTFRRATKEAQGERVVIEEAIKGATHCICGIVEAGTFMLEGIFTKVAPDSHMRFACSYALSERTDQQETSSLQEWCSTVLSSLGLSHALVCLEIADIDGQRRIVDITFGPDIDVPFVLMDACSVPVGDNAIRMCVGDPPIASGPPRRYAAIHWIPSGSGIVADIPTTETIKDDSTLLAAEIFLRPGDVMGHVMDTTSRDAVGYVIAAGESSEESYTLAKDAAERSRITTKPFYH